MKTVTGLILMLLLGDLDSCSTRGLEDLSGRFQTTNLAETAAGAPDLGEQATGEEMSKSSVSTRPGPATPAEVQITEVMIDPSQARDQLGEWFEVTNPGPEKISLKGITIISGSREKWTILNELELGPGRSLVLGRSMDRTLNGGVVVDAVFGSISLGNKADNLALTRDGHILDQVEWTSDWGIRPGRSISRCPGTSAQDSQPGSLWRISERPSPGTIEGQCPEEDQASTYGQM